MIRSIRDRERGMSFWPFVVTLVALVVFVYMWYAAEKDADRLRNEVTRLRPEAAAEKERFNEVNLRLIHVGEATGFTDAEGKPVTEQIRAGTQAFLDNARNSLSIEMPTKRYQQTGAGGTTEEIEGERVRAHFMPPKNELPTSATVESAYPIVVNAGAALAAAYKSMVDRFAAELDAKATLQQQHQQAIDALNSQIADLRTQVQAEQAQRAEMERDLKDQLTAARAQTEQATSELQEYRGQSEQTIAQLESQVAERQSEITVLTRREVPFVSEGPDGEVLASGAGVVVVNRGKQHMLMPGTVFTVLGRQKGGALLPKATIKITTVDDDTARGRIMEQTSADPILQGDLIQSAVYSPDRQLRFALIGDFTKMGRSQAEARLKALGAQVDVSVTPETHYLIVGGSTESVEQTDAYRRAKEYGITILTEDQLASFTRY